MIKNDIVSSYFSIGIIPLLFLFLTLINFTDTINHDGPNQITSRGNEVADPIPTSTSSEKAKQPLLYPFFRNLCDDKFKVETDAQGADGYLEGVFILETKSDFSDWLPGFYQALHYQKRFGLVYQLILVIAHKFVGIWRVN